MKSRFISTVLILYLVIISPLLFGEDIRDRPIVLIHGLGGSSRDMETMKNELIKKGVDEKNIKLINLTENYGSIIENAQYVGNEIKKISAGFDGKKVMAIGYSMGGEILDFLSKNQQESIEYNYDKMVLTVTPMGIIPNIQSTLEIIPMPTHMEKYIDEIIMIGSGPSDLARAGYTMSLTNKSLLAYQDLIPNSYFQNKLNSVSPNPLIAYNTISGNNTWGNEADDDVVPNEYSQRDYAKNNYMIEGVTHTEIYKNLDAIKLAFNEINNGALSNKEIQIRLEVKRDQLTLQRNIKKNTLTGVLKNAPCGAKTTEITVLQDEISSINQEIGEIEGQINTGTSNE